MSLASQALLMPMLACEERFRASCEDERRRLVSRFNDAEAALNDLRKEFQARSAGVRLAAELAYFGTASESERVRVETNAAEIDASLEADFARAAAPYRATCMQAIAQAEQIRAEEAIASELQRAVYEALAGYLCGRSAEAAVRDAVQKFVKHCEAWR